MAEHGDVDVVRRGVGLVLYSMVEGEMGVLCWGRKTTRTCDILCEKMSFSIYAICLPN